MYRSPEAVQLPGNRESSGTSFAGASPRSYYLQRDGTNSAEDCLTIVIVLHDRRNNRKVSFSSPAGSISTQWAPPSARRDELPGMALHQLRGTLPDHHYFR